MMCNKGFSKICLVLGERLKNLDHKMMNLRWNNSYLQADFMRIHNRFEIV